MDKHIFIQDPISKDVYYNITEVTKIIENSGGIYDIYFRDGHSMRVSKYHDNMSIMDIIEFAKIG